MLYAQIHPAFTHDHYFANPPAWLDGAKPDLCCTTYGEFVSRGGFSWDNPAEDSWRPHFIESGHGTIRINHGPPITLGPGDVFIMRPGRFYHREESQGKPWRYRWLMLRGDRVADTLKMARLPADEVLYRPGLVRKLEPVFTRMRHVLARERPPLPSLCALGWDWVAAMQDAAPGLAPGGGPRVKADGVGADGGRAGLAIEWLREHYQKGCTVEDAAKAVNLSRSGLFRLFRDHTGQTPKDYLDHLRIEHAAHLLRQGGYVLKEVAQRSGFSDTHHFSRAFARKMGAPPLAWASGEKTAAPKQPKTKTAK